MRQTGHQGRRDANHKEIVAALRKAGASVLDLGAVGRGCPDLLVGWQGFNVLIEIKTKKGRRTEAQECFDDSWNGQCTIVRSIEAAINLIEVFVAYDTKS